jgi:hypothetical protein
MATMREVIKRLLGFEMRTVAELKFNNTPR